MYIKKEKNAKEIEKEKKKLQWGGLICNNSSGKDSKLKNKRVAT